MVDGLEQNSSPPETGDQVEDDAAAESNGSTKLLDRLSVFTALVTILTFMKESGEVAEFALQNPQVALGVGAILVFLFLGDLVPRFKHIIARSWSELTALIERWTGSVRVRRFLGLAQYAVVFGALLLVIGGGLTVTTRGVFYIILESSAAKGPLVSRAHDLNEDLNRVEADLEVRVINPRSGTDQYAIATGPYLRKDPAARDLERLRAQLQGEIRADAWVSRTRLRTVDLVLRKLGL